MMSSFLLYGGIIINEDQSQLLPGGEAAHGHSLTLLPCRVPLPLPLSRSGVVVALEGSLRVLVAKQHLVFLEVLDFGVFRDAFLIVGVIFFDALGRM
jgi:hypothetical protein